MEKPLDKTEVIDRDTLLLGDDGRIDHMKMQGVWGENIVWFDGKSYIPVLYHGQEWKYQVHIKPRDID